MFYIKMVETSVKFKTKSSLQCKTIKQQKALREVNIKVRNNINATIISTLDTITQHLTLTG